MLEMLADMGEEYSWLDLTVPEAQSGSVKFEDIQGSFRWWNMIGSFKGLFKVENAEDNIWAFHGVTWRDEDEEEIETEDVSADRDTEYFGLAILRVLDKRGKSFVELLYNCTRFTEQEKRKTGTTEESGMGPVGVSGLTAIPPPKDYVRILCKKYKGEKTGLTLMLSGPEGTRLMRNANIDMSETRGSPVGEDNGEEKEHVSSEEEDDDAEGSHGIDEDVQ
ncbi:hypothetical protein CPC08DRAFT_233556 [Agrocybe pediades]|nr:hypothetical protein CPC08DRAFT_233556 [Agrocybe pediades]